MRPLVFTYLSEKGEARKTGVKIEVLGDESLMIEALKTREENNKKIIDGFLNSPVAMVNKESHYYDFLDEDDQRRLRVRRGTTILSLNKFDVDLTKAQVNV